MGSLGLIGDMRRRKYVMVNFPWQYILGSLVAS
jgi:hypothetical protein